MPPGMVRMCECPVSQVDTGKLGGTFAFFISFHIRALAVGPEEAVRGPPKRAGAVGTLGCPLWNRPVKRLLYGFQKPQTGPWRASTWSQGTGRALLVFLALIGSPNAE